MEVEAAATIGVVDLVDVVSDHRREHWRREASPQELVARRCTVLIRLAKQRQTDETTV